MANKTRAELYKAYLALKNKDSGTDLSNKIDNYKTRLSADGYTKDSRNLIEKALNLPEDQNVLFDVAELLGRPQQALFGGIKAAQEGDNILTGAKEGITGEDFTWGGELLRNAGIGDDGEEAELFKPSTWGVDDIGGLALDIVADPLNIAYGLGAASKVAGAGKLAKGADVISDTGKVIGTVGDSGKVLNKAGKATHYIDKVNDMVKPIKKDTTQRLFSAIGDKVVKPTAKLSDNIIGGALRKADDLAGITYTNPKATLTKDIGKVLPTGIKKGTNIKGSFELYKETKDSVKNIFNFSKSIPENIWNKAKTSEKQIRIATEEAEAIGKYTDNAINNYAKVNNLDTNTVQRQAYLLTESKLNQKFSPEDIINKFDNAVDNNIIGVPKNEQTKFGTVLSNMKNKKLLNYKQLNNGDFKITSVNPKVLKTNPEFIKEFENIKFNRRIDLSDSDKILLKEAINNKEFINFYDKEIAQSYNQVADIFKKYTKVDFSPVVNRPGYLRRTLNESAIEDKGSLASGITGKKPKINKTLKTRKISDSAAENAKRISPEYKKQQIESINKQIENQINKLSKNKLNNLETKKLVLEEKLNNRLYKISTKISKVDETLGKKMDNILNYELKRQSVINTVNYKNIKKFNNIATTKELDSIVKYTEKGSSLEKQINDIMKTLETDVLSKAKTRNAIDKIESLNKRLEKSENNLFNLFNNLEEKKLKNGIDSVKDTLKTIKSSDNITRKIVSNEIKSTELKALKKELNNSIGETITKQKESINTLESQIKNIDSTKDGLIINKINRMKNNIKVLESKEAQELFNINYSESLFDFIDNVAVKQSKGITLLNDVLFDTTFNDSSLMRVANMGEKAPIGYKKISANSIVKEMESWDNIFKTDSVSDFIETYKDTDIIIDKRIANMINPDISSGSTNTFLNIVDKFNNTFKKFKTLSPGFQMRNIGGGYTNQLLAGVPNKVATPFNSGQIRSLKILNNSQDLIEKSAKGLLKGDEIAEYKLLSEFIGAGFHNSAAKLYDIEDILNQTSKNMPGKIMKKITKVNNDLNQTMDSIYKMNLMDYFLKNPAALAKTGYDSPINAVKGILFSPNASDLSLVERNYMKRIIPFYTFTKQNLMFQMKNSIKNPKKYKQLIKANNMMWDNSFGEDEYMQWQKEGFELPLPFKDDNGNALSLKTNLPLSDLGEFMSNPLKRVTASTSPLIRMPFEKVSGIDTFTGADISDESNLDFLARNSGLDIITNQVDKIKELPNAETKVDVLSTLVPSVIRKVDTTKNITSNQYQELNELSAYVKKLKEAGIQVRTLNEIQSSLNLRLKKLEKSRNKAN